MLMLDAMPMIRLFAAYADALDVYFMLYLIFTPCLLLI